MNINIQNIKPTYMSESEVSGSDIYLQNEIVFEQGEKRFDTGAHAWNFCINQVSVTGNPNDQRYLLDFVCVHLITLPQLAPWTNNTSLAFRKYDL